MLSTSQEFKIEIKIHYIQKMGRKYQVGGAVGPRKGCSILKVI